MKLEGNIAILSEREQELLGLSTEGALAYIARLPISEALDRNQQDLAAIGENCATDLLAATYLALRSVKLQLDGRRLRKIAEQVLAYEAEQFAQSQS